MRKKEEATTQEVSIWHCEISLCQDFKREGGEGGVLVEAKTRKIL